jgi:sec-independent protein translocase protein TatA
MGLDNPLHIAFLLIVLLLVFGAKRLPEVGRSLGSGLRGFKDSLSGDDVNQTAPTQPQLAAAPPAADATQAVAQAAPPAQATSRATTAPAADVTALPQVSEPLPPAA